MQRGDHNNEEHRLIKRIVMWLLALATLAEQAGSAPAPIRFFVLWLLRSGEAHVAGYAQDLAMDMGFTLDLPSSALAWRGNCVEDALCLAYQLRILAGIMEVLAGYVLYAADTEEACFLHTGRAFTVVRKLAKLGNMVHRLAWRAAFAPLPLPAPDTS